MQNETTMKAGETASLPPSIDTRVGYIREFAPGVQMRPWPTEDELDPLNWSRVQKWTSLGIVMWM